MQIVHLSKLKAFLTGPSMDPEQEIQEEMAAFADQIIAHTSDSDQWFVFSDSENGDEAEIRWPEFTQVTEEVLVPEQYNRAGSAYYGMGVSYREDVPGQRLYSCYLGGSPLNSASGFVIGTAVMGLPE